MEMPTDPNLGAMIRGYCLEEALGRGKLTTLYHARTEELWLPPEVVMMLLHVPDTLSAQAQIRFSERFLREARCLIKLRHPSLFPLFGYGKHVDSPYLILPDVPGSTLVKHHKKRKRWSPSEAFAVLAPLCSAFDYIHDQGLCYQFFTPANIVLQDDVPPQITGLGLAQILLMAGLDEQNGETWLHLKNIAGDYIGMPEYLAPEVIRGEPADRRSDIYSLGIILFELLTGKPPFTEGTYMDIVHKHIREPLPSLHKIAPDLPFALELIINRALHRNPENRFPSAGELVMAFSQVFDERLRVSSVLAIDSALGQVRSLSLSSPSVTKLLPAARMPLEQARSTSSSIRQMLSAREDLAHPRKPAAVTSLEQVSEEETTYQRGHPRQTTSVAARQHVGSIVDSKRASVYGKLGDTSEASINAVSHNSFTALAVSPVEHKDSECENREHEEVSSVQRTLASMEHPVQMDMENMAQHIQQMRQRLQKPLSISGPRQMTHDKI